DRRSKKPRLDRTFNICQTLIQPFNVAPTLANQIPALINSNLFCKLPVAQDENIRYPELDPYVYCNDRDSVSALSLQISTVLSSRFQDRVRRGGSEDMMHWVMDTLVTEVLGTLAEHLNDALPIDMDRNKKDTGTTTKGNDRPDFLCMLKDVLLFKGEEKPNQEEFGSARMELLTKFNWFDPLSFGTIRFMICYAAAGPKIRFFALDGSARPCTLTELTPKLDLSTPLNRIKVIQTVINIARILVTIVPVLPQSPIPLGLRMKSDETTITFLETLVVKEMPSDYLPYANNVKTRVRFLSNMYKDAKGHRGLVQAVKVNAEKGVYKVTMQTRGLPFQPANERDLQAMIRSVLTGLVRLHDKKYVHRDIRLPNILYAPNAHAGYHYVLIDFEHGGQDGEIVPDILKDWDDNTLHHGKYNMYSDLYQLGKILDTFPRLLSPLGVNMAQQLSNKQLNAKQLLSHQWIQAYVNTLPAAQR
ncbi:9835_t:CDS:2, partial [Paraglomus brasilianum]